MRAFLQNVFLFVFPFPNIIISVFPFPNIIISVFPFPNIIISVFFLSFQFTASVWPKLLAMTELRVRTKTDQTFLRIYLHILHLTHSLLTLLLIHSRARTHAHTHTRAHAPTQDTRRGDVMNQS